MLKRYKILNGKIEECQNKESQILVFAAPDEQEKKFLIDNFQLDEHTLNSALDPEEPSRLEFEPNHLATIFKRPRNYSGKDQFLFKVASTGVFLFKDKLIIVMSEDIPIFSGKYFNNIASLNDGFLRLIYNSIYHFLEHLRVINMISEEIERKINQSMENKYLLNLFSLEKSLVYYISAINLNGFVFEKLKHNSSKVGFSETSLEMLEDITIENSQCLRQAEIYSNILARLMDARVSIVNNTLNILMKTLSLIAIGIMIPTFVVSLFSMNVHMPLEKHPHAFWLIVSMAAVSVAVAMFYWKKIKKW